MEITSVCPYCGKEMRDGAIPVLRDIYWCPRGEDGMLKDGFGDEKEQVWLGRAGLIGDYYTPARYCESCKVVIVSVPGMVSNCFTLSSTSICETTCSTVPSTFSRNSRISELSVIFITSLLLFVKTLIVLK